MPLVAEGIANLIAGSGVTITGADNPGLGRSDITFASTAGTGNPTWQTGTDASYQIAGTTTQQIVIVPTLTAARAWTMPTIPVDQMPVGIYDARGVLVNAGNTLSVTTVGGTDHFWVGGVDKGTTYTLDANLFKGGTANFVRRAATSTWELAL